MMHDKRAKDAPILPELGEDGRYSARFAFVGERRSPRAVRMNVRWEDGRLAAKTLHDALRAMNIDPRQAVFLNLFSDDGPWSVDPAALARVRSLAASDVVIVGMGRRVQAALDRVGLSHLRLTHPAARGAIRARAVYHSHVAAVLGRSGDSILGPWRTAR